MLNFACCLLLVVLPAQLAAQALEIGVDPRVELLSILFRLAGNPEYNKGGVPVYDQAIERHFEAFKDHQAVRLARQLRNSDGVSYDAVMSMAVHVTDIDTLAERIPFNHPNCELDQRWHGVKARKFLEAARLFVKDSKFQEFLAARRVLYDSTQGRLSAALNDFDLAWFDKFFGAKPGARFVVIPGLVNGGGSYGPKFRGADEQEELYSILGVWRVDGDGLPIFNKLMLGTVVHEFTHSYANPLIMKYARSMDKAAAQINQPVKQVMQAQAYGNPRTLLHESLVRACTVRYVLSHDGPDGAQRQIQQEESKSFLWTRELSDLLGEYEKNRETYPTLEAFMPRIVAYFNDLAPRAAAMVRAYEESRPHVVSMTPANGATDVDPALKQMVVRFDKPMRRDSYQVMHDRKFLGMVSNPGLDESGTVFTIDLKLEPGREYELSLNSPGGGNFVSSDGKVLKHVPIKFGTRASGQH